MKLTWVNGVAQSNGWEYAIQTERPLHEPVWRSLYVKPPGAQKYLTAADDVQPPVPYLYRRFDQGTTRYVKAEAQAHADLVEQEMSSKVIQCQ